MSKNSQKLHAITITGKLGAGKSSTAIRLAEELEYQHLYAGRFFREYAEKHHKTFHELMEDLKDDPQYTIDRDIDGMQFEKLKDSKHFVVEGRVSFHLFPNSFKLFLDVPDEIGAQRILDDLKNNPDRKTERVETLEEVIENMHKRHASEVKRYKALYNLDDHFDPKYFDCIIDTSTKTKEEVVQLIIAEYKKWIEA